MLALAVESPEDEVRRLTAELGGDLRWAIADAAATRAFGEVSAVPTLLLFDRQGRTARVLYGAPPDLHAVAEEAVAALLR